MHVVAEAQRNGGVCAYIDAEHAMDPIYARAIGVDVDQLLISQPDTGEQALEIADMLTRSGAIDVIVIDSVAALTPRAEIEGEMGDTHVGLQARLMSQALRKLTGNLSKTRWSGAQVLLVGPTRHPPHRSIERWHRNCWEPNSSQGCQEQGVTAVPSG